MSADHALNQQEAAYGTWPSPITPESVVAGSRHLVDPYVVRDEVWWVEGRPQEGGRRVVCRERSDGTVEDLLAPPWSAVSRVHEYGGTAWLPVPELAGFVFSNRDDQRVHLVRLGQPPIPLTPEPVEPAGERYADFATGAPGEVLCVREQHHAGEVHRSIAAVALDGSGVRDLVSDGRFLAAPTLSPDGRHLAWLRWDHPSMPWDETEVRLAPVTQAGELGDARTLVGGEGESVLQPTWYGADLLALSDRTGWWNLYRFGLDGNVEPLHPAAEEFGGPLWELGARWFAPLSDGRVVLRHGRGDSRLAVLDPTSGVLTDLELPYRAFGTRMSDSGALRASGLRAAVVAGHPTATSAVVAWDGASGHARVVRRASDAEVEPAVLPEALTATLATAHGDVEALIHPPRNRGFRGLPGELTPYVVDCHGGPTAHFQPHLDLEVAYFTSRGIGYVKLNYRGSSGYGRAYRDALRGGWGVVDVEDAAGIIPALTERFGADPARVAITGRSAGGATALAAVVSTDVFAAALSDYGVADFAALAQDTHDFESRYLDSLVAPWPEGRAVYEERSPLRRIDRLASPVLLLQGADDPVVPVQQAEAFAAAAAERGLEHELVVFEGESHGWTRSDTMIAALEAKLAFLGRVFGFRPAGA